VIELEGMILALVGKNLGCNMAGPVDGMMALCLSYYGMISFWYLKTCADLE